MEHPLGYLVLALGVLACVWAFVRPRRGREPHCRACRFSLAGLTEPARCPECGKGLTRPRAIILGHRPSPKRLVFWSVGLVLAGSALLALDRMNRTGFFPLTSHKPAWLLHAEAYALGDLRASMATTELASRIADTTLGKAHQDRLVRTALARHAQTWRAFPDSQWAVITHAMGRNGLTFKQIERVWKDCYVEAKLISDDLSERAFYAGEGLTVVAGVRYRAGSIGPVGMGNIGFAVDPALRVKLDLGSGEPQVSELRMRGPIIQRINALRAGLDLDQVHQLRLAAPDQLGTSKGVVELEFDFAENMVAMTWPGITDAQLAQLATLKETYSFPITLRIVDPASLDVPLVHPQALASDPTTLIDLQIVQVYSAAENNGQPGVMFRIGSSSALDPSIGLGGYLVFELRSMHARAAISYSKPHATTQQFIPLDGFGIGDIIVRYEHDRDIARDHRDAMTSVLGGSIDLGTITIPESE